jgi:hypothetical protein
MVDASLKDDIGISPKKYSLCPNEMGFQPHFNPPYSLIERGYQ